MKTYLYYNGLTGEQYEKEMTEDEQADLEACQAADRFNEASEETQEIIEGTNETPSAD
jgi:hypothetical protein